MKISSLSTITSGLSTKISGLSTITSGLSTKISDLPTKFFHLFQFIIPQFVVFVEETFHPPGYLLLLAGGQPIVGRRLDSPCDVVDILCSMVDILCSMVDILCGEVDKMKHFSYCLDYFLYHILYIMC